MKIVKIVRKDSRNVALHLDNDDVFFLVYEIFVKSGLRKEDEISESRLSSLVRENRLFHMKQKAFRYLGRRRHSTTELRMKLRSKDYGGELIEEVLGYLTENNYLNDYEFAVQFADENIKNRLWGVNKVKAELLKRGISGATADKVITEKFSEEDVLGNAIVLLRKKIRTIDKKKSGTDKIKLKLFSYLAGKGYEYDIIRQSVEMILREEEREANTIPPEL